MLFFFAPGGIEKLFEQLAAMDEPAGDKASMIEALNALGKRFGVEYLAS